MLAAGSGGQGILTLGRVMAYAAMNRQWQVSCLPAYGAEMRGGYVYCLIIMSSRRGLLSPVSGRVDAGIFMQERMLRLLAHYIKPGGTMLLNSSLVRPDPELKFKTIDIAASQLAESLGNLQVANMVMAGALGCLINREYLPLEMVDLMAGLEKTVGRKEALESSRKALETGWSLMEQQWKT